jgi:hypothetical protein
MDGENGKLKGADGEMCINMRAGGFIGGHLVKLLKCYGFGYAG